MRCCLLEGSVARISQRCRCNLWTPRNESWRRTVGLFREENIILEARSILHAVWYAESNYLPGRLLILLDNLALVLALCKERTLKHFLHCLQSCVESLRLVSGQDLSHRPGGYRRS